MRPLTLFLIATACFATNYTSTATGTNWGQSTHWSPTGVPGDGDCVSIGHNTVVNQDVGTAGNGIRLIKKTAGALTFTPGVTLRFGSTGTDPIGSGSASNPDCATATMFGIFNASGTGTVNIVGNSGSRVTITTGNDSSPWYLYVQHAGANFAFQYVNAYHMGRATTNFRGLEIYTGFQNFTVAIDHNYFHDMYQLILLGIDNTAFAVNLNWFNAGRASGANGDISGAGRSTGAAASISDNTVTNPVNDAYFIIPNAIPPNSTIARNAVLGTSTAARSLVFLVSGGSGHTVLNNVLVNTNSTTGLKCVLAQSSTTTVQANYMSGCFSSNIDLNDSTGNIITGNFLSQEGYAWFGQGNIFAGSSDSANVNSNVIVNETVDSTQASEAILMWNAGVDSNLINHNTILGPPCLNGGARSSNSLAVSFGEPGATGTGNIFRNNLVCGWVNAYYDDANVAYAADFASVGVHHNAFFDNTTNYMTPNGNGEANFGTGHPNAAYGELSLATSPQFIDPTRRVTTWDSTLGGPGTNANVFTELAKRSGFGGTYNTAYNIPDLMTYTLYGFRPLNPSLRGAASDGSTIGSEQSGLTSVSRSVSGRVGVAGKVQ